MSDITVTIGGVPETLNALNRLTPELRQQLSRAIQATTLDCQSDARRNCPVGTPESTHKKGYRGGRLRASIAVRFPSELVGEVFTNVYYAIFTEEGTRKMRGTHWMKSAFNINAAKLREKIKDVFQATAAETSY